jgi:low temperature requirement protein LtrA
VSAAGEQETIAERRTSSVELLWDLVFVFAVTQISTLLAHDVSWTGFARAMLVLAFVWWAWSAFVWAANAEQADSPALRAVLLPALLLIFVTGLAIPRAFGGEATLAVSTYAGVRLLHLVLYADASRRGNAAWSAIAGFAVTVVIGMTLLIVGSLFTGATRYALWAAAVAIDYSGPGLLTRARLRGLQRVAVAHFAERYGQFVLICLGESIVAIGVSASSRRLSTELVSAVLLGALSTVAMWWIYFARYAAIAEQRLREHDDPVLAAADAYSYLHLLLVAGIIVFAVGIRLVIVDAGSVPPEGARLALCGGAALYLAGNIAFRRRLTRAASLDKLAAIAALGVLYAAGADLAGLPLTALVTLVLAAVCLSDGRLARITAAAG